MKEVELKLEIPDDGSLVKSKIESSGAQYRGKYNQTDFWFDTEDQQLKQKGMGLRVRKQNGETTLTLKAKQVYGKVREAEELEVAVGDFENFFEILQRLGFVVVLKTDKEREVWAFKGLEICLDKVRGLGLFLEFEGPQEKIEEAINNLGLESLPRITEHYGQLFEKRAKCEGQGE